MHESATPVAVVAVRVAVIAVRVAVPTKIRRRLVKPQIDLKGFTYWPTWTIILLD